MTLAAAPVQPPYAQGRIVPIDLAGAKGGRSYDIAIGDNNLAVAGELIRARLGKRRCLVVTDSHVGPLYLQRLEAVLATAGHTLLPSITLAAGEASKDYATLQSLLTHILTSGVDRQSLIIALGGGVIGDLTGCAASLALRGLDFVQIPTTLLAQVDSSVGGKTGINTVAGKNTVGTFYQPRLVIADVSLLDSLPERELLAGYAEIVKYGLIKDRDFFTWCVTHAGRLLHGDREAQIHAVGTSCAHKARIVAADEREAGERALLNFGHTFGHALEAAAGYGSLILHGEAVAIGMVMALKLSARLGLCPHAEAYDVRDHLAAVGLPVTPPAALLADIDALMGWMAQDKKALAGQLTLILAHGIGHGAIHTNVAADDVRAIWQDALQ